MTADNESAPPNAKSAPAIAPKAYLRLLLLGAAIGIPAAVMAVGFLAVVHQLEEVLWHDLPDAMDRSSPPWYLIVGLPVVGACVVLAARRMLPGDGGHRPIDGLSAQPTPVSYGPSVALAALGTLPFGAVLGPEAPLIALGSVVGVALVPFVDLGPQEKAVLATAGSFAAIASVFGGPIVAGVLLIEAGIAMGATLIPMLLPGLVAAAIGYLIFIGFGDWAGIDETVLTVPGLPLYDGAHLVDLVVALGVGVVTAVVVAVTRAIAIATAALEGRRLGMGGLLVGGGLAVGTLALLADGLGANSQDVLFSGQASLPDLVVEGSAGVLLVLVAAKGLAYAVSLACGFRGGPVFPAIFLGVAIAMFAVIAFDVSPTLAVAVGTAAGMAAATRLIFSSLVLAALLVGTNGVDAIPAAVLAGVAAWVTAGALDRRFEPHPQAASATAVP